MREAEDLAARGGRLVDVQQLATLANQRAAVAQEAARARSAEAALLVQRKANEAQAAAQRQADEAQRLASSMS